MSIVPTERIFSSESWISSSVSVSMLAVASSTIQHADNIIVLSHGKILEQGTHQQLLARHGRYYQLYTLQYHKEQLNSQ